GPLSEKRQIKAVTLTPVGNLSLLALATMSQPTHSYIEDNAAGDPHNESTVHDNSSGGVDNDSGGVNSDSNPTVTSAPADVKCDEIQEFLESFRPSLVHLGGDFLEAGIRTRRDLILISQWPRDEVSEFFSLDVGKKRLRAVVAEALTVRLKDERCICANLSPLPLPRALVDVTPEPDVNISNAASEYFSEVQNFERCDACPPVHILVPTMSAVYRTGGIYEESSSPVTDVVVGSKRPKAVHVKVCFGPLSENRQIKAVTLTPVGNLSLLALATMSQRPNSYIDDHAAGDPHTQTVAVHDSDSGGVDSGSKPTLMSAPAGVKSTMPPWRKLTASEQLRWQFAHGKGILNEAFIVLEGHDEEPSASPTLIEEERERMARNSAVCAAKEAAASDPTNRAKTLEYRRLVADYAEVYGVFVADAEIRRYIGNKTRQEFCLDELRHRAGGFFFGFGMVLGHPVNVDAVVGCPFAEPWHIDAYVSAAETYHLDFGHPFKGDDGMDECLDRKKKLRQHHQQLLSLHSARQIQLAGRKAYVLQIANPFPSSDPRHAELDTKLRERVASYKGVAPDSLPPAFERGMSLLTLRNRHYADPSSLQCQEVYCTHQLWAAEIEEILAEAKIEAREKALPPALSTHMFYGAVADILH
ncbi:hypothetical protein B0H12DRAFT_1083303, partial [Mycena haematopus]